jgi:hypothetical protein
VVVAFRAFRPERASASDPAEAPAVAPAVAPAAGVPVLEAVLNPGTTLAMRRS